MAEDASFAEKLAHWRRYGAPGQIRPGRSNTTDVRHEHTGERVGTQTEHWDGRVDARAEKVTVQVNPALVAKERHGPVQEGRHA